MKTVSTFCRRRQVDDHHQHSDAPLPDLPPREVLDTAGDLLRALAAPVRIAIVLQLRESSRCVHELVDALGVPQPLVSQHLRILKAAGVVAGERSGREVLYRLVDHHLAHIVVAAVTHAAEDAEADPVSGTAPGVRATRQRAAISALLENLDEFRSAQDLHDELRRRGEGIGLTTVYRTLQSMAAAGLVDTLRTDTGESVYRRCSEHHHHHLVCRVCGCTVEVQGGQVETWAADVAREHGFSDVSHTIEIFGVCGELRATTRAQSPISAARTSAPVASTIRINVRSASSVRPAAGKL